MGGIRRYNVYDNGELIMEKVQYKEIVDRLGGLSVSLTRYASEGLKYKQRYTFEHCDDIEKQESIQEIRFREQWEEVTAPFKNVVWVQSGGKQLKVGGAHG